MNKAFFIYGPTAVGKTDFANMLASCIPCEIINMDAAQLYAPLTIGTAKPDWQHVKTPHHLFDICDQPMDYSVAEYRNVVISLLADITKRGKIPVFVGGSGFYMDSLFFPPVVHAKADIIPKPLHRESDVSSWEQLHSIDPVRALEIHPHDIYRINRALILYQQTQIHPSSLKPAYCPITAATFIFLTQSADILKEKIKQRIDTMYDNGWIAEVESFLDTPWEQFLLYKKWIGYPDIIRYCRADTKDDLTFIKNNIVKNTWHYARRQLSYARMFTKKIRHAAPTTEIISCDATSSSYEVYIKQLVHNNIFLQKEPGNE